MGILITAALSVLAAAMYRMGGSGNYPKLWRKIVVPVVTIMATWAVLGVNLASWWAYVLFFGLSVGAISSYHDYIMGKDLFWLHGFILGLAGLPLLWVGVPWYAILARAVVLAVFMGVWCQVWEWDIAEETGRGFSIVATIPLLLI